MRFAVLADAHIGRSIPLAIAEHRRKAFSTAFTKAVDAIVEAGVDYVFLCGDLFERRTLRPHLVQFAHDELYRLAKETEEKHGRRVKVLVIRGNHDGRPQSDTLDYIKHPLADYLHVFEDDDITYRDEKLHVVGLNYYDQVDTAFDRLVRPAFEGARGVRVLMVHGFVQGYNQVPPYSSSLTLDQLVSVDPAFVLTGHYHRRCPPRRLPNGGWIATPGSLEMYDFAESPDKGFYICEAGGGEPEFTWVPIEPMHAMKQTVVESDRKREPPWYAERILGQVEAFREELRKAGKQGYLRVRVQGGLRNGYPGDIDLARVNELVESEPLLLWVDIDTLRLEMPLLAGVPERGRVDVREFFSGLGEFSEDVGEMHSRVREALEEEASLQTGLLTSSQRAPLVREWVERFEARRFREAEA
jgi:DNA repair exonuclease SbcCD nuclease subunit